MKLKKIITRNYRAAKRRGQISDETTLDEMLGKLQEEVTELMEAYRETGNLDEEELSDVALVCFTIAKHNNIDLKEAMAKKTDYNLYRTD